MNKCRYIGEREQLRELTALVRTHPTDSGLVYAQFDKLNHPYVSAHGLAYGWHLFSADEFVPETNTKD